jgi:hypothetical protein
VASLFHLHYILIHQDRQTLSIFDFYILSDLLGVEFFSFLHYKDIDEKRNKICGEDDDRKSNPLDRAAGGFENAHKVEQRYLDGDKENVKQSERKNKSSFGHFLKFKAYDEAEHAPYAKCKYLDYVRDRYSVGSENERSDDYNKHKPCKREGDAVS